MFSGEFGAQLALRRHRRESHRQRGKKRSGRDLKIRQNFPKKYHRVPLHYIETAFSGVPHNVANFEIKFDNFWPTLTKQILKWQDFSTLGCCVVEPELMILQKYFFFYAIAGTVLFANGIPWIS